MMPADILFTGEAPGKSEDLRGDAFVGPSGNMLNKGIERATTLAKLSEPPSFYIANVVRCRPTDSKGGPNREPTEGEAFACRPHLQRTFLQVKPKRVVFLGRFAERYCRKLFPGGTALQHPAYILRRGGIESAEFRSFARDLSSVFRALRRRVVK